MTPLLFELLRFEATPVGPAVAVVEVDGTFAGLEPVRPRLLVETGGVARELPALEAGGNPGPSDTVSGKRPPRGWSATFAVPLSALTDPGASFALVPGRGPLIELPAPTTGGGEDDDRFVRLARTANDLRHRLGEASEDAAAAAERLAEVIEERDALAGEVTAAREQLAAAEARAAESHDAALTAREAQAGAEGEADAARAALERARDEARADVRSEIEATQREAEKARKQRVEAEQRAVAAEDDARAARRELRDARARVEALLRQGRTSRTAAARTRVPARTADEPGDFRAARLAPEWADEDDTDTADESEVAPLAGNAAAASAAASLPDDPATASLADDPATASLADDPAAASASDDSAAASASDDSATASLPDDPAAASASDDSAAASASGAVDEDEGGRDPGGAFSLTDASLTDSSLAGSSADHDPSHADGSSADHGPSLADTPADDSSLAGHDPSAVPGDAETAALPPTLHGDDAPRSGPALWTDETPSLRILRPRTRAGRERPAPAVTDDPTDEGPVPLEPAAVGARLLRPAEVPARRRAAAIATNPRVIVGAIFLLLLIALVLIFAGIGPV